MMGKEGKIVEAATVMNKPNENGIYDQMLASEASSSILLLPLIMTVKLRGKWRIEGSRRRRPEPQTSFA